MQTITNDVISLSLFTSSLMYHRVFPNGIDRQSIFSGTKLKAELVKDRSGSHTITYNKIEFPDNPFKKMNLDNSQKVDYTNKVVDKAMTNYELANITIQKGEGNILTIGSGLDIASDWHYDNVMATIDASVAEDYYRACIYRGIAGMDLTHLIGIEQTIEQKQDPKKNLASFYDIAKTPESLGLTPHITRGDLDGLEKVISEIRNYFSFSNITSGSPNLSDIKNVLFIISSNILRTTFKQFNAGVTPYMTMENFIKEQLPEVQIVGCDMTKIGNSMIVIEQTYSTLLYGLGLTITPYQTDHDIVNLRVKNTIGSVICEDPSKVILYKDFMTESDAFAISPTKKSNSSLENEVKELYKKQSEMQKTIEMLSKKGDAKNVAPAEIVAPAK